MNGTMLPIKCTSFLSEREDTVLQWTFKLNSAAVSTGNWHLKNFSLKVKVVHVAF